MNEKSLKIADDAIGSILATVKEVPVLTEEDHSFLVENKQHLAKVFQHTHMWRTDIQKKSIVNDMQFPTIHAKFHQTMLEQKVQFDQAMYLAKDFELKKLEIEEDQLKLEELKNMYGDNKLNNIKIKKLEIELQFKSYELNNMKIAMNYRMAEVKGWKKIQTDLMSKMETEGLNEETIWNKEDGELTSLFYLTLNNLQGIKQTTDSAEYNNLLSLAVFSVKQVQERGLLEKLANNLTDLQKDSLGFVLNTIKGNKQ